MHLSTTSATMKQCLVAKGNYERELQRFKEKSCLVGASKKQLVDALEETHALGVKEDHAGHNDRICINATARLQTMIFLKTKNNVKIIGFRHSNKNQL